MSEETEEEKRPQLSHQEALSMVEKGISRIIATDPLLADLPDGVTLEELNSLLALEQGRAMTLFVKRADGLVYDIIIEQKTNVLDLKKAIRRYVTTKLEREGKKRTISWRYVWRIYWLYFEGQKLMNDHYLLKDYGIGNNSEITFIKRLRVK
ncbi:U11/U12 small nuclear ribonucleoprotein 25 kDa protein-like [Centruroides sculpturatus]|uniref:U11/U12 small nuclear ribonucleoprotein 25 kDa protein-like n=1 Tax=Centruroides sculpturatus TaxID=218467 RepID=UPI000C6D6375|nr:U11/U12 small nuclear ribonucleoprotein 25 kDa protein-like [Centruroides sculpturatus]